MKYQLALLIITTASNFSGFILSNVAFTSIKNMFNAKATDKNVDF